MTSTKTTKSKHYFRALVLLLATTLALAAVMTIGGSANKAEAATAVTKTFSNTGQISVPSGAVVGNCSGGPTKGIAAPYPSHLSVGAFRRTSRVLDVNLTLKNYTHTFPDDVDVLLVHGTQNRTVLSDVGGNNDVNNVTLTLDDEAPTSLLPFDNSQIVSGTFRPNNFSNVSDNDTFPAPAPNPRDPSPQLSGFDGLKANGDWDLYVLDDASGDCGAFAGGWSLTITARSS